MSVFKFQDTTALERTKKAFSEILEGSPNKPVMQKVEKNLKTFMDQAGNSSYKNYFEVLNVDTYAAHISVGESGLKIDFVYVNQDILAFRKLHSLVMKEGLDEFLDVGSRLNTMFFCAQLAKCYYIECRGNSFNLAGVEAVIGEAQSLPFENDRFKLITCLHALEHFGLGKYGDTIDYYGDIKALEEYHRVLEEDGYLFLSVPVSHPDYPRIEFHGQRVYNKQIIDDMLDSSGFDLVETHYIAHPNMNARDAATDEPVNVDSLDPSEVTNIIGKAYLDDYKDFYKCNPELCGAYFSISQKRRHK